MAVGREPEELVVAVVERILVDVLPVQALPAVVVLPDLGGGVAVFLQDPGDVRNIFRQAAVEAALRSWSTGRSGPRCLSEVGYGIHPFWTAQHSYPQVAVEVDQ